MLVTVDKPFFKDLKKINDQTIKEKLKQIIQNLTECNNLTEIGNLKKLKGTKNFYRIRIGNYRLGLCIENDSIELLRFVHRKEIYKYFP